jgi:eukaryotic-like serine/threonine-protein kinase
MRRLLIPCWVLLLAGAGAFAWVLLAARTPSRKPDPAETVTVAWVFEPKQRGAIVSSPLVAVDRVYVAAIHDTAFWNAGAVYCLDRATKKLLWRFDDEGKMQHMYSSPCLAQGRLYIGEGMHANLVCKLYCLDADSGRKLWQFEAEGHIESSPCVADGKVFFGAGDDGIYCLDAVTGKKRWQFQGPFHIDSSPAVSGRRLYAGSGLSRMHRTMEAFCLDTEDGSVLWRLPTDLPVWGSPVLFGEDVFFGLGNGRLTTPVQPPQKPAGALICVAAKTGKVRYRYDVSDAICVRATAGPKHVFFGARDGHCYCLDRLTGRLCWKQDLGSPVMTSPALLDNRLYVIASEGRVCCLEPDSGLIHWTFDVAASSKTNPRLYSSPAAVADASGGGQGRRIYFGAELCSPGSNAAVLYCLRDGE